MLRAARLLVALTALVAWPAQAQVSGGSFGGSDFGSSSRSSSSSSSTTPSPRRGPSTVGGNPICLGVLLVLIGGAYFVWNRRRRCGRCGAIRRAGRCPRCDASRDSQELA
ncbi:MAG: hypothetical protein KC586_29665 [Myxococcales bacterium]|nr:hypothetical protein [Myxococcales bacterium]